MAHLSAVLGYLTSHAHSVFFALIATYVIGSVWHGPLFGKLWIKLNNMKMPKKSEMKFSMMVPGLIANFFLVVIESAVLGRTFQIVRMESIADALVIATILWLPFTALVLVNIYAWAGKPVKLMILDCLHALFSLWAVAAILYAML